MTMEMSIKPKTLNMTCTSVNSSLRRAKKTNSPMNLYTYKPEPENEAQVDGGLKPT